jgi:hypothetical protein
MSQENPFTNPALRYGVGAVGALAIAVLAYSFLDGTTQLVAYGIAVLDFLLVPQFLNYAAEN